MESLLTLQPLMKPEVLMQNLQIKRFNEVIRITYREKNINYGLVHAANSGAIIDFPEGLLRYGTTGNFIIWILSFASNLRIY